MGTKRTRFLPGGRGRDTGTTKVSEEIQSTASSASCSSRSILRLGRTAAVLGVLATSLAPGAGPAAAATVFPPLGEIQEAGCCVESFRSESVAIDDQNGHIYLADSGAHRIRDYASATDPSPVLWNGEGTPAGRFEGNLAVAVDDTSGDVYVADSGHAVIDKFDPDGNLITSFGDSSPSPDGQLAGLQTPAGGFAPAEPGSFGIAVDQASGDLYAIDAGHRVIDVFSPQGTYLRQITATPGELYALGGAYTDGIAVDEQSGELLVSDSADLRTYRFELATGASVGVIDGSETPARSFGTGYTSVAAQGSDGTIYITDTSDEVIDRYEPDGTYSGEQIAGTPQGVFGGVGVDQASGDVFVAQGEGQLVRILGPATVVPDVTTLPATGQSTTTATLNGEVDPVGREVGQCLFEYGPSTAYGQTAPCWEPAAGELGAGSVPVAVHAELSDLTPGATYHYRLLAANSDGVLASGTDQALFTGASIDATSVSAVSDGAATLEAEINPHGLATSYRFEYGPTTAYGASVPIAGAPLGAGTVDAVAGAQVAGLAPASTYHYRAVAENALGTVSGPDRSFVTQSAAGAALLPDSRVWELVSPPEKHGVPLLGIGETGPVIEAAADGQGLTYGAVGSIGAGAAGNRATNFSQLLSTQGAAGWSTLDISTPHQAPAGLNVGAPSEYQLFAGDLDAAAVEPRGATPLSPQTSERTPYRREGDGTYTPLVDPADVRAGTGFGGVELSPEGFVGSPSVITGTPDLTHILLRSPRALTDEFSPAFESPYSGEPSIYEWSSGTLALVSEIPPGGAASCTVAGCVPAAEVGEAATVGNQNAAVRNAISSDGSRVVFATPLSRRLYLRDLADAETIELDAAEAGCSDCESGGATYQDASADDSRIFFTDSRRLTADSTASGGAPDLYMCQIEGGACALRDLTANRLDPGEAADVQVGAMIGAAEDGAVAYFVADGALTSGEGAVHGDCRLVAGAAAAQSCNLYRYDLATHSTHLVAVLSGADDPDWLGGEADGKDLGQLTARVSPNGRWLAFMSERPLSGYENRDLASAEPDEEVYLYDAAARGGAGALHCASCDPTGARPTGIRGPDEIPAPLVDGPGIWRNRWFAANVPGWTRSDLGHALYQSRYLSDSGRLFFDSSAALVPADRDGSEDVYESEPAGVGSCTTSSTGFSASDGGCLSLISSGTSPQESAFLDASESGNDVFFLTASRLVPRDEDSALDIYDASVGGDEPAVEEPKECSGEECQPPVGTTEHPTPGTAQLDGPGNLVSCPRGKVKRHGRCAKRRLRKTHHEKGHGHKGRHAHAQSGRKGR
jgi:hypothetical protein